MRSRNPESGSVSPTRVMRLSRGARCSTAFLLCTALLVAAPAFLHAQSRPPTQVLDASALKPPAGARVAIVVFSNMQCPACASSNPLLRKAEATYHIPLVHYEVLIPSHNWSQQAAVNERWFETRSKALGDEYRDAVFASQPSIYNPAVLSQFTDKFARSHNVQLPFSLDPQGKLLAAVQADNALAGRTGIRQTPTIFIVTSGGKGAPFVEVVDQSKLYQLIDQALSNTRGAAH
jgi:protein-disulfide isomerase